MMLSSVNPGEKEIITTGKLSEVAITIFPRASAQFCVSTDAQFSQLCGYCVTAHYANL